MTLHDRILGQSPEPCEGDYYDGFAHASRRASKLAAEADELMGLLADALGILHNTANHHCSDSGEWFTECDDNLEILGRSEKALERYSNWKERTR
jgi:hypothetical protein